MSSDTADAGSAAPSSGRRIGPTTLSGMAAVVLLVSLLLTSALSFVCYRLNRNNEHRLLQLEVQQTATLLGSVTPLIDTPLATAAQLATTSDGSVSQFRSYITAFVGRSPFASASLWQLSGGGARLLATVGRPPALHRDQAARALRAARQQTSFVVLGPLALSTRQPRVGYVRAAGKNSPYVVYAESALPPHRNAAVAPSSGYSNLRFALYLGSRADDSKLLESNVKTLPISGHTSTRTVPFGTSKLTIVGAADGQIGGSLSGSLWWIVAIGGTVLSVIAAIATDRLIRRRRQAEELTGRMRGLLAEQRGIAQTLQQALLPETLPTIAGVQSDARYVPGANDVAIGGDWYDLMPLADQRFFLVIGDVSGRGLKAGTAMASLRFAIHGFVSEGHEPGAVLERLAAMVDLSRDGHFATVLCAMVDVGKRTISFANAGHLPPLLISDHTSGYVDIPVGPPIGVDAEAVYGSVTVTAPPRAMLFTFTDGLVEKPGETLDVSLERLRSTVDSASSLNEVFDRVGQAMPSDSADDIAILGVQWLT